MSSGVVFTQHRSPFKAYRIFIYLSSLFLLYKNDAHPRRPSRAMSLRIHIEIIGPTHL
jgi:hypothetical protein